MNCRAALQPVGEFIAVTIGIVAAGGILWGLLCSLGFLVAAALHAIGAAPL